MMPRRSSHVLVVALAFVAFVSLGLPDGLLGVGWASMRAEFGRPLSQLGLLLGAGTAGYLTSSFLAGQLVRAIGVGRVLVASSLLVTAALSGNSLAPAWGWLILFALVGGLGGGAIDAGINTFAASRFSPRIVNWLHAFWGVGASTGPLLMTAMLASHHSWRLGYGVVAGVLGLLSILFIVTHGLWRIDAAGAVATGPAAAERTASIAQSLAQRAVWMQIALFFIYGGIETSAGQLFYTLFTETRGIAPTVAGVTVGGYWAALTAGRILFGQLAATWGHRTILRSGMLLAPAAAVLLAWNPTPGLGLAGAVLLGLGLAPIFPTLISVTPGRVGHFHAAQAVGFQVAAASVGVVVFPSLVGLLARTMGLEILGLYLIAASLLLLAMHEVTVRASVPVSLAAAVNASDACPADSSR
jgi:MFS family permease